MGIAGAGFGAAKALEEIIGEQMLRAQLAAREQEAASRTALDQQRLNESIRQNDLDEKFRTRQEDRVAKADRDENNTRGVRRMIGEGIQRRVPMEDMQGMAFSEGIDLPQAPVKKTRTVTGIGPKGEPINRVVGEDEEVQEWRAPKEPTGSSGPKEPRWVRMADGSVVDINGIAPKGSKPYDAVAERSSAPVNKDEAIDTAREAKRLATALRSHKGLGGAFGVLTSGIPTLKQDTADAEILRDSLTSLLTMENMGKMKGVLSDSDMKILRAASSTIHPRMGDAAARAELDRIADVMARALGEGPAGQMPKMDMATSRGTAPAPAPAASSPYEQYLARKRGGQ